MVPKGEVLESDEDPTFAYDACRTPWRLGDKCADHHKVFIMLTASGNCWLPTGP